MKIFSQLINAQLENRSSDYSATVIGRIWWNTATSKVMSTDGSLVRAFLKNDQNCVFGNSGTASQNTRLNRSAANALQLVTGNDTTAEGTTSTSCAQIDARAVNYTTAGLPAASSANKGRLAFDTTLGTLTFDNGGTWTSIASGSTTTRVGLVWDAVVGSAAQVTSGAATHSTWASAIAAVSAGATILALQGSWTENITVTKQLNIIGHGFGSFIDGTITFNSSSDQSSLSYVKVSDNITLSAGADGVNIKNIWLLNTKNFLIDTTVVNEYVEANLY